jgi:uracil phosphoribosyltransferase
MHKFLLTFSLFFSSIIYGNELGLSQLVYEIRDPTTQAAEFRNALEKIGEQLAYKAQDLLETQETSVKTLTGAVATHSLCSEEPVLVTILRAGLPLNAGVQKVFPNAEVGFLAMSRNEETLKAQVDYIAIPDLQGKTVILTDTMLATGGSILDAIQIIEQHGPKKIVILSAIASAPGVKRVQEVYPDVTIFAAAIDPLLNEKGYIVPGLGDAGDRSFGNKHHK